MRFLIKTCKICLNMLNLSSLLELSVHTREMACDVGVFPNIRPEGITGTVFAHVTEKRTHRRRTVATLMMYFFAESLMLAFDQTP